MPDSSSPATGAPATDDAQDPHAGGAAPPEGAADASSLGYESAREELVGVVQALEAGSVPLERSLELWERGEALAARCEQLLEGAQRRLDAATAS
ncbi:exodeoxyribonuclease VII small subunit [Pseudokineococcus sp. 1T1Z-3]|uniref:exodeoxyribonuclease VII small subunit n=1 Tax=Pseudokineococcus sp. 1T1Z-3 TaxID=3132745 RepID=UPI00309FA38A